MPFEGQNEHFWSDRIIVPPEVYKVMLRCWEDDSESRANFEEVHSSLNAIYEQSDL